MDCRAGGVILRANLDQRKSHDAVMKTILVPIDFSPVSRHVIDEAITLARAINGRLVVLHAVQPPAIVSDLAPFVGDALQFTAEVERGARQHLRRLQKSLMKRTVTLETICEQGFPTSIIIARAKELDACYIVLGSHGHTAFYDLVVGSVASGVLKRAICPLLIVPAQPKGRAGRSRRK